VTIRSLMTPDYRMLSDDSLLDNEFTGVYSGDLLSMVLHKAKTGAILITVLANMNTLAVASLREFPAVIITENMDVSGAMIQKANEESIALIKTTLSSHEVIIDFVKRNRL